MLLFLGHGLKMILHLQIALFDFMRKTLNDLRRRPSEHIYTLSSTTVIRHQQRSDDFIRFHDAIARNL